MDRLNPTNMGERHAMPASAPLAMPEQNLGKPHRGPRAPDLQPAPKTAFFRWMTFIPALMTTSILIYIFQGWFAKDGFAVAEIVIIALVAFSAFWISLSLSAATIGLVQPRRHPRPPAATPLNALDVALLVPVYNEEPVDVFRRLSAIRDELSPRQSHHRFAIFILSDTRDDDIAEREWAFFQRFRCETDDRIPVFYRRRADNFERKTGNIRDWITEWGGAWDAFVTLDADSLISADTFIQLSDGLALRPATGLIQTVPRLLYGQTLFSRMQQFANNVYGGVLARGLERWCGVDGNYWGHNAIIRTRAFAECAGLPRLPGKSALSGTIKSHDFVEAALLRRAGWGVELRPSLAESYEEIPQSLVDYVLRDRRWCQGNLQHLRLLTIPGLTAASRFHMLQGAMAYVSSVVWFGLLVLFTLMGTGERTVLRYFSETNPLYPVWPEADLVSKSVVLAVLIGMLILPKVFGFVATLLRAASSRHVGGYWRYAVSAVFELALAVLIAPIMMVQHVVAIARTALNFDTGWVPQNRDSAVYPLTKLLRFHALESVIGFLLVVGMASGFVSMWLAPIGFSLFLAAPISFATSLPLPRTGFFGWVMKTSENFKPPHVVKLVARRKSAEGPPIGGLLEPLPAA